MLSSIRKHTISGSPQIVLTLRLLLVLLLMAITRLLIYFLHPSLFPGITVSRLIYYAFAGLRFDLVAVLYANILYIVLLILPFRFRRARLFSIITDVIFYIANIILLVPNLADTAYYPFSLKRMTIDIFNYISTGDDTANMMPQFIRDYWYVFLIWLTSIFMLVLIVRHIRISNRYVMQKPAHYFYSQVLVMMLFLSLTVLGIRGGIQLKPIGILDASEYAPSQETPVVLNSAFTLMRSYGQQGIKKLSFYTDDKAMRRIFDIQKNYAELDSTGKVMPMHSY